MASKMTPQARLVRNPKSVSAPSNVAQSKASGSIFRVLNKFVFGESTQAVQEHPLYEKYGEAFELYVQAESWRQQESIEEAIRFYQRALSVHPEFYEAYVGLGRCFRRRGDLKNSITAYQRAITLNQFSVDAHIDIAKSYHEAGYLDKGIFHFRRAIRLAPHDIEAKFNLALCLELNEQMMDAADVYVDIIEQDPGFAPAFNNLGSIYMRIGRYRQAEELFRELLELTPEFSRAILGLAICLDRTNRPKDALPFYEKLLLSRYHSRNRDFIESRIRTIRRYVGLKPHTTTTGLQLVRVK
jgi:tetratricopeptide (TPR) repeat protein